MGQVDLFTGTIVARSTPPGRGAVSVIRISGPEAGSILSRLSDTHGMDPKVHPRRLVRTWIVDEEGERLDEALVVFFPRPRSYTGEDMAEIHCHGGEAVVSAVLREILNAGAREASRGEFTRRAFESGKLDLSRAEAVLHLINADTREGVKAAVRSLSGEFEDEICSLRDELLSALTGMEAAIDFPDEPEPAALVTKEIGPLLGRALELERTLRRVASGASSVVIAGRPNVGKSSLMNAIARRKVSIVTSVPGTTRDAVSATINLGGMKVLLVDTAGQGGRDSTGKDGVVEREAYRVAEESMKQAQLLLWVTDGPGEEPAKPEVAGQTIWVQNKSDLIQEAQLGDEKKRVTERGGILISALTGYGLDQLVGEVQRRLEMEQGPADGIPVTLRQEVEIRRLISSLRDGSRTDLVELAAVNVRDALKAIGTLLGEVVEADVLDKIFSEFCIGK